MQILIAEDDHVSRKTLGTMLKKQGHDIVETQDGEQAWQIIQEQGAPPLIILDIIMPNMDGLELCKKNRTKDSRNPPYIIFVTAKTEKEDVIQGLDAGANDYISKPYEFEEL